MDFSKEQLKKISEGDEIAFKAAFDLYFTRLVGFAMKYIDDLMVAEDIVSDVFKNIWEKRSSISQSGSFSSYLYTSVRNGVLNNIRNTSVERNYQENVPEEDDELNIHGAMIKEEVHYMLYNALRDLPKRRRKIFELSVLHGLKSKEIAEELGISVNTIKTQKKRALQDLREKLRHLYLILFF